MSDEIKSAVETGLQKVREQLDASIARYEQQVKDAGSAATEVKGEVSALSTRFAEMQAAMLEIQQKGIIGMREALEPKQILSAGAQFIASDEFKRFAAGGEKARIEIKAAVDVHGTVASNVQRPGVSPGGFVPTTVRGSIVSIPTNGSSVTYLRESAWTNSAAEASHGAAKNDSAITFEEAVCNIRTVAHWIPVTKQLLDDAPAVAAYIDTRLRDGLAQRVDRQLIQGNGTSPNLSGFTDSGNFTAYTPTSDDTLVDAINRIKYTMWAAGYAPDTVYVNPADWGAMERTRESAGSGVYLYGAPGMDAGLNSFGLRIVITPYLTDRKSVV